MRKEIIQKIITAVACASLAVMTLAGCGSGSSGGNASQGAGTKILYTVSDNDDAFRALLADGIAEAAKAEGVTVDMQLCGPEVESQLEQVSSAKSKGYSAIIVRLTDVSTVLQIEVAAGGLPLVFINNQPSDDRLKDDQYVFVGSDEYQAGQYQAEFVYDKLGKPSSMNVIIMEGEKGHSGTIGRTASVKNTLKDLNVDANYVFVDYANWTAEGAYACMETFAKTGQSADAVFCNNDTMATGVANYYVDQGATADTIIPIAGVDASADGCAYVDQGLMCYTVLQDGKAQAAAAVKAAKVMGSGGSIDTIEGASSDGKYIWIPFKPVDKSNVKSYM